MFLNTREGQEEPPMEPGARWCIEPWDAPPPLNPHRFTPPANPRPFVCPVHSPSLSLFFRWTTVQGPASITVTGTTFPCASKTWVIPNFFPTIPVVMVCTLWRGTLLVLSSRKQEVSPHVRSVPPHESSLQLDLHFHPGRKGEFHERVAGRGGGRV